LAVIGRLDLSGNLSSKRAEQNCADESDRRTHCQEIESQGHVHCRPPWVRHGANL